MEFERIPILNFLPIIQNKPYKIPLDHAFEEAFELYPIVPIMGFKLKDDKWNMQTVLLVPDDGTESTEENFSKKMFSDYTSNINIDAVREIIRNIQFIVIIPRFLFSELRQKVVYISPFETYSFRYIFEVFSSIITSATIIVDPTDNIACFEKYGSVGNSYFMISPVANNEKTMKNQLVSMARLLKNRILRDRAIFSDDSDTEILVSEDEYSRIEKKPKKVWKFVKNKKQKIVIKGEMTEDIFKFCKDKGYEFQDN